MTRKFGKRTEGGMAREVPRSDSQKVPGKVCRVQDPHVSKIRSSPFRLGFAKAAEVTTKEKSKCKVH